MLSANNSHFPFASLAKKPQRFATDTINKKKKAETASSANANKVGDDWRWLWWSSLLIIFHQQLKKKDHGHHGSDVKKWKSIVTTHFTMANSFHFILGSRFFGGWFSDTIHRSRARLVQNNFIYWDNRSRRSADWHIGWKLWTSHVQGRELVEPIPFLVHVCWFVDVICGRFGVIIPSPVRTLCFLNKQPSFSVVLFILDNSQSQKTTSYLSLALLLYVHPPTLVQSPGERRQQQQQQLGTHYRPHWPNWKVKCCLCVYFTHDAPATREKKKINKKNLKWRLGFSIICCDPH